MAADLRLSNSNCSSKEHSGTRGKTEIDTSGLLCSTLLLHHSQPAFKKTEACQERVGGRCVIGKEAQH